MDVPDGLYNEAMVEDLLSRRTQELKNDILRLSDELHVAHADCHNLKANLNARIAAAQQEALKLASAHYPVALFICGCGWQAKGNTEQTPREQWASHVFSLLPAAQKASEEHDKLLVAVAVEAAASVLENEINLREKFDAHMEPIDKLATAIRSLTPADAHAALAEFSRKERLDEAKWWYKYYARHEGVVGQQCLGTPKCCACERIASLSPAELQKEGK